MFNMLRWQTYINICLFLYFIISGNIMNLLKLLTQKDSTKEKAILKRDKIATAVIENLYSSHAISRVVHNRSNLRWTSKEEKELLRAFENSASTFGNGLKYTLLSVKGRSDVLLDVASKVKRSPIATQNRLRKLGALKGARLVQFK